MTEQEARRLAIQAGIDPRDAVNAIKAEQKAREQGVKIYKWQRENQDQANIIRVLVLQNEANLDRD